MRTALRILVQELLHLLQPLGHEVNIVQYNPVARTVRRFQAFLRDNILPLAQ